MWSAYTSLRFITNTKPTWSGEIGGFGDIKTVIKACVVSTRECYNEFALIVQHRIIFNSILSELMGREYFRFVAKKFMTILVLLNKERNRHTLKSLFVLLLYGIPGL
jgi:hypothetical protein